VNEIELDDIDSLLLPGCMDISTLQLEESLLDFIRYLSAKGGMIASISSSPYLLAKAGVGHPLYMSNTLDKMEG